MPTIDEIVAHISSDLEAKNEARDRALADSRQIIRHAANTIRALHRNEFGAAAGHLQSGRAMVDATRSALREYPDLYWTGYVQDAQKELAEAYLVEAMIQEQALPDPAVIGVEAAPYLNGMAEAASEMRRYVLDMVRHGGPERMTAAERVLRLMDDVYSNLITVDFPDAVTGGLRRTTDQLRAVLERTRGDLTVTMRQAELERALARAHD